MTVTSTPTLRRKRRRVGRVVIVHLAGSKCRGALATSTDPLGVSCGRCQRRRVVRAAVLSLLG